MHGEAFDFASSDDDAGHEDDDEDDGAGAPQHARCMYFFFHLNDAQTRTPRKQAAKSMVTPPATTVVRVGGSLRVIFNPLLWNRRERGRAPSVTKTQARAHV